MGKFMNNNDLKTVKEKNGQPPLPKPMEVKIADAIFLKVRNNMVLFKDLSKPKIHYSAFIIGSKFDLHITQENQVDSKKKHVQLLELQIDWKYLFERMAQDLRANLSSIIHEAKTDDPDWQDMEIEYMSPEMLRELLQIGLRRNRWNVNEEFFCKLEESLQYAKLEELSDKGITVGWSSEGFFVISNGADCWVFDIDRLVRIANRNLELSIRRFHMRYYTLGIFTWRIKICLLNLKRIVTDFLRKRLC